MIDQGIRAFSGKRVLLLQGPMGPFFALLARDLRLAGAEVYKVNFNAGDCLFYRSSAYLFDRPLSVWPEWFADLLDRLDIDVVMLFGDCRPIHSVAHKIAVERSVEVGVFEEGYIRPDYITFEQFGVNGHSRLPRTPVFYLNQPEVFVPEKVPVGKAYWRMVWFGFLYFVVACIGHFRFPYYEHHRKLTLFEFAPWIRSAWRRVVYAMKERNVLQVLSKNWKRRFFLVPLQVFNDSQLRDHSGFDSVDAFVERVMESFAQSAPSDVALVLKHHPMDRGYTDYSGLVALTARRLGLQGRCFYIHDQHVPTLLRHAAGVVVVNSTTGLQALIHGVPVKVLGEAIFDLNGLCHKGPLDQFWSEAQACIPNRTLLRRFTHYLIAKTQLNGSFYKSLPSTHTGFVGATRTAANWGGVSPISSFGSAESRQLATNRGVIVTKLETDLDSQRRAANKTAT